MGRKLGTVRTVVWGDGGANNPASHPIMLPIACAPVRPRAGCRAREGAFRGRLRRLSGVRGSRAMNSDRPAGAALRCFTQE